MLKVKNFPKENYFLYCTPQCLRVFRLFFQTPWNDPQDKVFIFIMLKEAFLGHVMKTFRSTTHRLRTTRGIRPLRDLHVKLLVINIDMKGSLRKRRSWPATGIEIYGRTRCVFNFSNCPNTLKVGNKRRS